MSARGDFVIPEPRTDTLKLEVREGDDGLASLVLNRALRMSEPERFNDFRNLCRELIALGGGETLAAAMLYEVFEDRNEHS